MFHRHELITSELKPINKRKWTEKETRGRKANDKIRSIINFSETIPYCIDGSS